FCLSKKIHTPPAPSQEGKKLPSADINTPVNHPLDSQLQNNEFIPNDYRVNLDHPSLLFFNS
ncbi:hypothetical protein, partial [uncultured Parabacteroides sp.]|uniref:hypothetical protein n=1 Tax=uncultured Parabacteroides sp. TaxID=512312 RepID=UPI0025CB9BB7